MSRNSRLNVAVVGVGALGRHHARILSQLDSVNLLAVADPRPEVGQAVAAAHKTRWVGDYHRLFDENLPLEAVSIAVPTSQHLEVASEFLRRGVPVLVEKPIAASVEQATRLVELADRHGVLLQVGHVERFNPATKAAWSLCGTPKYFHAERLSPFAFRSTDIGVVHDLMIHDIDLALDLVQSPVRHVEAFGTCILGTHEDSVRARLTFESGCIADLVANRVNPTAKRHVEIWSTGGRTLVDLTTREVVHYRPSETLLYGTSPLERAAQPGADIEQLKRDVFGTFLEVTQPQVPNEDALTAELASFVQSVRRNQPPVCDGRQALKAMQVADQILQCVQAHLWDGHREGLTGPHFRLAKERKLAG